MNSQRWHAVDVTTEGGGPGVQGKIVAMEGQSSIGAQLSGWERGSADSNWISKGRMRKTAKAK